MDPIYFGMAPCNSRMGRKIASRVKTINWQNEKIQNTKAKEGRIIPKIFM